MEVLTQPNQPITNALTIDVEDYFMVSAFADVVKFEDWPKYESRIEKNTSKILELLDEYGVKATFFVLGWVAEHYTKLVKDIHSAGHEVASHGYNHKLIYDQTPEEFRKDIHKTKNILEDITGNSVVGYRATSFSIMEKTMWALDILIEEGFHYDSSIFPIRHDRYGYPGFNRFPVKVQREGIGEILEIPPSTIKFFGQNIPIAGGGYLRLFPAWITKRAVKRINLLEKKPVIFYFHPWEIDIHQPKLNGRGLSKMRHYINIDSTFPKLNAFLKEFKFKPLRRLIVKQE